MNQAKTMQEMLKITQDYIQRNHNRPTEEISTLELQRQLTANIDWQWHRFEQFAEEVARDDDQFDKENYLQPLKIHREQPEHFYYGDRFTVLTRLQTGWKNNLKGNTLPRNGSRMQRREKLYGDIVGYKNSPAHVAYDSALPHCMGLLDIWLNEQVDLQNREEQDQQSHCQETA